MENNKPEKPNNEDANPEWFRTDERENALDSLEKCDIFLRRICEDDTYLKWAILAADHSLYGFLICNLAGSDYYQVLVGKALKKGKHKLIDFGDALKRAQNQSDMEQNAFSKPLKILKPEEDCLLTFHMYRNILSHFIPSGLSIGYNHALSMLVIVIDTIEKLAFQTGNMKLKLDKSMKSRTEKAIKNLRRTLENYRNK